MDVSSSSSTITPSSSSKKKWIIGIALLSILGIGVALMVYFFSSSSSSSGGGGGSGSGGGSNGNSSGGNVPSPPSPPPPPSPAAAGPCNPSTLKCTSHDSYSVCHPDGYPTCVVCSDYQEAVESNKCGSNSYPQCGPSGVTTCIACSDFNTTKCTAVNTYPQCGTNGTTQCIPCPDYNTTVCPDNQFAKCVNGKTQCLPCGNTNPVQCALDQYAKCSSDGTSMTCISCDDSGSKTCSDSEYPQCVGTPGGNGGSTQCVTCADFSTKSPSCPAGTFAQCQLSADKKSYATTCVSDCAQSSAAQGCEGPDYQQVCNYSAHPPQYECQYIGPCQGTPPNCNSDETQVCDTSTKQWTCVGKPGSIDAILQKYGLTVNQVSVYDTTGTCPGGTCTIYCQDGKCDVPVLPTVGPYNMGSGTRCLWYTPVESSGALDTDSVTKLNNPPYNLIRQSDGTLKLVNLSTMPNDYVTFVTPASASVPYAKTCYVPNTCDPSSKTGATVSSDGILTCKCAAGHYGLDCTFTSASCSNVPGSVPTVNYDTCENCGQAREGDSGICLCSQGGWGTQGESLGSCTCPSNYAGPTCNYSRNSTCSTHGTPQNNGSCVCDAGFAGPNCSTGRQYCSNAGNPTYTNGVLGCVCDTKDYNGPQCQYSRANTCNGVGVPNFTGQCQCDDPHQSAGPQCQYTRAGTCNGGGTPQPDGTCVCDDANHVGLHCEFTRDGTCHSMGTPQPDGSCHCDSSYYNGAQCQYSWDGTCNKHGAPDANGNCTCFEYSGTNSPNMTFVNVFSDTKCTSIFGSLVWTGSSSVASQDWMLGGSANGNAICTQSPVGWVFNPTTGTISLADGTNNPAYLLTYSLPLGSGSAVTVTQSTQGNTKWSWDWRNGGPICPAANSNLALSVSSFAEGNAVVLSSSPSSYPMSFSLTSEETTTTPPQTFLFPCPKYTYSPTPSWGPCTPY